jgi:hypothetical protein
VKHKCSTAECSGLTLDSATLSVISGSTNIPVIDLNPKGLPLTVAGVPCATMRRAAGVQAGLTLSSLPVAVSYLHRVRHRQGFGRLRVKRGVNVN